MLVQALTLPLPAPLTDALGVHQSDLVIRSALIAAIADLRANPWLLDYVFASLPRDSLTKMVYGEADAQQAKKWFLSTDIKVLLTVSIQNPPEMPCVSVTLMGSAEQEPEGTLGDTHYQPFEDTSTFWPVLAGPFTPTAYAPGTGLITLDPAAVGAFAFSTGMLVVDANGVAFPILETPDTNVIQIAANAVVNLKGMVVKAAQPSLKAELESSVFRETYGIGCHTDSEPIHLVYLHSIVVFCLLRYRQALLEARGFERSTLNSSDFKREDGELPEFLYTRYCQITGTVRQVWPKTVVGKITEVDVDVVASNDTTVVDLGSGSSVTVAAPVQTGGAVFPVFWGVASEPGLVNAAFVQGLASSALAADRVRELAFTGAGPGQFLWYAYPRAFGSALAFLDTETALDAGWSLVGTVLLGADVYDVYRSNQANLGHVDIQVM